MISLYSIPQQAHDLYESTYRLRLSYFAIADAYEQVRSDIEQTRTYPAWLLGLLLQTACAQALAGGPVVLDGIKGEEQTYEVPLADLYALVADICHFRHGRSTDRHKQVRALLTWASDRSFFGCEIYAEQGTARLRFRRVEKLLGTLQTYLHETHALAPEERSRLYQLHHYENVVAWGRILPHWPQQKAKAWSQSCRIAAYLQTRAIWGTATEDDARRNAKLRARFRHLKDGGGASRSDLYNELAKAEDATCPPGCDRQKYPISNEAVARLYRRSLATICEWNRIAHRKRFPIRICGRQTDLVPAPLTGHELGLARLAFAAAGERQPRSIRVKLPNGQWRYRLVYDLPNGACYRKGFINGNFVSVPSELWPRHLWDDRLPAYKDRKNPASKPCRAFTIVKTFDRPEYQGGGQDLAIRDYLSWPRLDDLVNRVLGHFDFHESAPRTGSAHRVRKAGPRHPYRYSARPGQGRKSLNATGLERKGPKGSCLYTERTLQTEIRRQEVVRDRCHREREQQVLAKYKAGEINWSQAQNLVSQAGPKSHTTGTSTPSREGTSYMYHKDRT